MPFESDLRSFIFILTNPAVAIATAWGPSYFTSFINLYPDVYILITNSSISCWAILNPIFKSGSLSGFTGLGYGLTSVISCAVGVTVGVRVTVIVKVFVTVLVRVGVDVRVIVHVGVFVRVHVKVGVGVYVGVGVLVNVGVIVHVGVFVGVNVEVFIGVLV